jgi:hypothetical protein
MAMGQCIMLQAVREIIIRVFYGPENLPESSGKIIKKNLFSH